MRFLADQNISRRTVSLLRTGGYDVCRVSDFLPAHADDTSILDLARHEGRVVITQDLDYSALLAASGQSQPSVVSLRLRRNRPEQLAAVLVAVLPTVEADLKAGAIAAVEDARIRVRLLPVA